MLNDGPNNEQNFQKGILNAKNNLKLIVKYLRFNDDQDNYKEYLDVYLPKLEGTEFYDEFKKDLGKLEKEVVKEAVKAEPKVTPWSGAEEEKFRALSAIKQRELIDKKLEGKERKKDDDSNADKRVSLYLS